MHPQVFIHGDRDRCQPSGYHVSAKGHESQARGGVDLVHIDDVHKRAIEDGVDSVSKEYRSQDWRPDTDRGLIESGQKKQALDETINNRILLT